MSGALLSLLSLALGAAIWMIAALPRMTARTRQTLIVIGVLAAPCLLAGCLLIAWSQGRFGQLRMSLTSVTAEVRQFPMTVGGDAERDDIVVARLAPSVASILPDPRSDSVTAPLVLEIASADKAPSPVVAALSRDGKSSFPTALPFGEGDAVCVVAPCEGATSAWAILRGRTLVPAIWRDGRVFPVSGGAAGPALPQRKTLLVFGGVNEWTPAQAAHPLRDYFPHPVSTAANGVMRDCERWLCAGPRGVRAPVRSVLFQKGGLGGSQWSIVLADAGARIARPDGSSDGLRVAPFAAPAPIPLGKGLGLDLWDIRYIDAPLDKPEARRGRLQLRRSLRLAEVDGKAEVAFVTAPTDVVGASGKAATAIPSLTEGGAAALAIGGRTAQAAGGVMPTPKGGDDTAFSHAAFDMPAQGADRLRTAHLNLDRFQAPWPMAWIAALWAIGVVLCCRDLFAARPSLWAITVLLQFLLALRFLFGLSGAAADPALPWRSVMADTAVVYVAVPAILMAWARWGTSRKAGEWQLDLAPPATAACVMLWTGRLSLLALLVLLVWAAAVVRRHITAAPPSRSRREAAAPAPTPIAIAPAAGVVLILAVLAARLLAGAIGWKERIDLGVMVLGISVIYTPLLVVGFSRMLAADQASPRSWARPALFYLLLVIATFVLPLSVRDSGYALMFAPIAGMAAWCAWTNRKALGGSIQAAGLWAAPAVAVLLLLIALPLAGAVTAAHADRLRLTPRMANGLSDADALDVLSSQAQASQNVLRLYLLGAPEDLGAAGSAEAESLKVWSAQLADYTGSLWGRGYLTAPNLTALRAVQNTDNLTAVQLMSPFGRLATGLLLGLLMATPIACAAMTRTAGPSDWRRISGFMALWCVFGAAAYMTFANLQLVPFTGRNAYLLAATSGSDLLEGAILFFLAAWGIGAAQPAKVRA